MCYYFKGKDLKNFYSFFKENCITFAKNYKVEYELSNYPR